MIFDRGLRRSLVALIAFTMPACADTLGPVDAIDMPKRWPPGPLRDFLEGLQAPDFPYVDGAPTSCCGAGDVVDTKFKVEPGDEKHPQDTWYAMLKGKWVRIPPTKIIPDFAPDGRAYLFVLKSYDPQANDYDEKIVCFVGPNGGN